MSLTIIHRYECDLCGRILERQEGGLVPGMNCFVNREVVYEREGDPDYQEEKVMWQWVGHTLVCPFHKVTIEPGSEDQGRRRGE